MPSKQMKRRIFAGAVCTQIVYNVPSGVKDPKGYDPEKPTRKRFKDPSDYEKFKEGISRRNHARGFNANFAPGDLYMTLTFDNDWEVHTFEDARRLRKNFARVLQRKYPDAVFRIYMGRGKGTSRIHFHVVCHGILQAFIEEKWKYGKVTHCRELREHNWYDGIDYGADYTGIANYLFDHWTEEQGGHRWFQTKNNRKPDAEQPTEVRVTGGYTKTRPPVAPKGYKLVETHATKYGFLYYKYVVIPKPAKRSTPDKKNRSPHRLD